MPTWDDYVNQREQEREGFDLAQICENGHLINKRARTESQYNKDYCSKCGKPTITTCPYCKGAIKGYDHASKVIELEFPIPSFCDNCGKPYPWISVKLEAAKDLINESNLNNSDKNIFSENLGSILHESPKTSLAANRIRNVLSKAGKPIAEAFYKIFIDVSSETAKKILFP